MAAYVYILTDGVNTKIGTTGSLDKRLSAYSTHNPNFYTYKTYDCSTIEEARKIEAVIKLYFKEKLTGSGKEWFAVVPQVIDRVVVGLFEPAAEEITPAMHGVELSNEAYKTLEAVTGALKNNHADTYAQKDKMAEIFAATFKLGIPEHRLPADLVQKDGFSMDLYNCNSDAGKVRGAVTSNLIKLPFYHHTARFYHLVKLSSGSYIAVCTSIVSMPYLKAIEGKEAEIYEKAKDFGLYAFLYNEWSWHYPDNTGLILFTQQTAIPKRISLWHTSLRKWVIERSKVLEQQAISAKLDPEVLSKTIYDICFDYTFPLRVQSAKELYDEYLYPYFYIGWNDDPPHFMIEAYKYLFAKWKEQ